MVDPGEVCVLIPALDEAETIDDVVSGFQEQGFDNILVVDGGSTDGTREIAAEHGARVQRQSDTGKGQAVREALEWIDAPYVLMLDGDGTYLPDDAFTMLQPLDDGAEHVIGNRFAGMEPGAMTPLNRIGNRLINRVFVFAHGRDLRDVLSGYRAFSSASVERLHLTADGFGIETELAVECMKHGVPTVVVPIRYRPRPEPIDPKLRPLQDGGVIAVTLYRLAKTNNPRFYFGFLGILLLLAGLLLGSYVGVEWVTRGVSHEVIAIAAASAVLFGVQLLTFGILSEMIVALHRERIRRLE